MTPLRLMVPVKPLGLAKSRLNLPAQQRRTVARNLLEQTIRTTTNCPAATEVIVLTADPHACQLAMENGCRVIHDPCIELNAALEHGLDAMANQWPGITAILVADLPRLTTDSLQRVLQEVANSAYPRHVANQAGTGTSMVTMPPGQRVPMRFGQDSAARFHSAGCVPVLNAPHEVRADLDTLEDLLELGDAEYELLSSKR